MNSIFVLLVLLQIVFSQTPPTIPTSFSANATVIQNGDVEKGTIYLDSQNQRSLNYVLGASVPYYLCESKLNTFLNYDLENKYCYEVCYNGLDCYNETCSCALLDLFSNLAKADQTGDCYSEQKDGTLWLFEDLDTTTFKYCTNGNIPLYVQLENISGEILYKITFESWNPGVPPSSVFQPPPSCTC
eukprot:TRINITY_DN12104_c0_g1_i1.p1 TRINITY_DN12104_c0_g1~~TRINITY_DN12104_c0_g1_i1.p1  ORF type:complete len:187 (-),score=25.35 TRINITY_DN12104_c0_g1_i1:90-650(-)